MKATITSKGQLTIPKPIRDKYNLKPGDEVLFLPGKNGVLELQKNKKLSFRDLKGILPKPDRPITDEAIEKAIVRGASGL